MPNYRRRYSKTSKRKGKAKVSEPVKTYVKRTISARKPMRAHNVTVASGADVTSTTVYEDLTAIAVAGAGVADDPEIYRSQQQIIPKKLRLSMQWSADSTAVPSNQLRLIVFKWSGERGADPPGNSAVWGDFFQQYWRGFPFSDVDTSKGKILMDKTFTLPKQYSGASALAGHSSIAWRKTIDLSKLPRVTYLSDASTAGHNHIYVCYVGSAGSGSDNSTLYLQAQVQYQE